MVKSGLTRERIQAELYSRSLTEFVRAAWHLVEPSVKLVWNWHIEALCLHLQAITEGRIPNLIINIPPGSGKSTLVSVLWPCWEWTRAPGIKFLFASHKDNLAVRDSLRRRWVIESDWYKSRWPLNLASDQNTKHDFHNDKKGHMIALGRGGNTGYRGDRLVLDDPNNATEMESEVQRESALMWFDGQWSTRGNDNHREVIIQQRTHEQDITGHALKQGHYVHLKLPMEFDSRNRCTTELGWSDPRQNDGELLDATRFPRERVNTLKKRLGPYMASGQLQQEPSPTEGGIIKRAWIRHYEKDGDWISIKDPFGREEYRIRPFESLRFATVDLAVTKKDNEKADPDYTVICSWCVFSSTRGPILLLLDVLRERLEGPDIRKEVEKLHTKWEFSFIAVEMISGFIALGQEFKRAGLPIRDISKAEDAFLKMEGDKQARMYGATPLMADGRFYAPTYAPWLGEYIRELTVFPNYGHDDQADCTSSAVAIAEKVKPWDAGLEETKPDPTVDSQGPEYEPKPASVFDEMRGSNDGRY